MQNVGYAAGSGVFTQSGGINVPFVAHSAAGYSQLLVGDANGGFGAYDLSGGS